MNSFTDTTQFLQDAQHILDNSDLLIRANCCIINSVLYERLINPDMSNAPETKYRFFFSTDDYDYLEDNNSLCDLIDSTLQWRL